MGIQIFELPGTYEQLAGNIAKLGLIVIIKSGNFVTEHNFVTTAKIFGWALLGCF
jgi:hypothetical protein